MNETLTKIEFEDTATAFAAKSDAQLRRAYWMFAMIHYPWLVRLGTSSVRWALNARLPIKGIIRQTLFEHFCGGEHQNDCDATIAELAQYGIGTILDYSVEGAETEDSFEQTTQETLTTIKLAAQSPNLPFCVFKVTGLAPTAVLEKVSASQSLTQTEQEAWDQVRNRVNQICQLAHEKNVRIFIDAEESWIQQAIDSLAMDMILQYNKDQPIVYNTYQLYLKDKLEQLKLDAQQASKHGCWLGAKLVRGAYMEKERDRAQEKGYPNPVQPNKMATDRDYNLALDYSIANRDHIALCAGTHNEASSNHLASLMSQHDIDPKHPNIYFSQLYGMSDHISFNLSDKGFNVAKYVPYGPLEKVMPYLFRRAEENTSVKGQSSREFTLISKEIDRRRKTSKTRK